MFGQGVLWNLDKLGVSGIRAKTNGIYESIKAMQKTCREYIIGTGLLCLYGGDDGIRTRDPQIDNLMR